MYWTFKNRSRTFGVGYQAFDLIKLLQEIGEMINVRATAKQLKFDLKIAAEYNAIY